MGLVVRVAYVLVVGRHITLGFDSLWYELQAGTLAKGHGYVDPDAFYRLGTSVPTANFPPLWPGLLALANLLGIDTERGYQLVGAALGVTTVVLTGLLGRRVLTPGVGLVAAGVVALSPALVAADGSLMSDTLYVAIITSATLVAIRCARQPRWWSFAALGLLLGVAALARTDAVILAPLLIGATAWAANGPTAGRRFAMAVLGLAVTVAALVPWSAYSSSRLGAVVMVSSNSGNVLEGANCEATYFGSMLGSWDGACQTHTRSQGADEASWAAAARSAGVDYAAQHPARLPVVAVVRVLRAWGLWAPMQQSVIDTDESRNRDWQVVAWAYGLAVTALAAPGAVVLARRVGRSAAPLAAVVAGGTITVVISNGNPRMLLACAPSLAVAAAATLVAAGERLRAGPGGAQRAGSNSRPR